jgi:parallel beta-helix repeat protein
MSLYSSSYNSITRNNIIANYWGNGISLFVSSNNNSIIGNNVIANGMYGISMFYSPNNNNITGNNIVNNWFGIFLYDGSSNRFWHNNYIGNTQQVYVATYAHDNSWDDGYPSGGNYWSDYTGVDWFSGPYQNEPGSDGIGDTPYVIGPNDQDRYPLMNTWQPKYDIAVTYVTPSKTVVGQGYSLNINVTVANQGEFTETFNIKVYANTTVISQAEVTLASGSFTTVTFTWNTTGFAKGDYTISAIADTVSGEIDTADNRYDDGTVIVSIPCDIAGSTTTPPSPPDGIVNYKDVYWFLKAYGSNPSKPNWNPDCDVAGGTTTPPPPPDNLVNYKDIYWLLKYYGKTDP